jgi:hypothetical protein
MSSVEIGLLMVLGISTFGFITWASTCCGRDGWARASAVEHEADQ